jgi:DNA helicase-4
MSEVKIYNSLVSLITSRKWSEFDAKLAEVALPPPRYHELLKLKDQAFEAEKREQEDRRCKQAEQRIKADLYELGWLLRQQRWTDFDLRLAQVTLSLPKREEFVRLKSQSMDANRKKQEEARKERHLQVAIDELKLLLRDRRWDDFDNRLAEVTPRTPKHEELLKLKNQALEADQKAQENRRLQASFDELKSLLSQRKWNDFDRRIAELNLPEAQIEELQHLKRQSVEEHQRGQEARRRQIVIDELESLLFERKWHDFDAKLAKSKLLESEREALLGRKAGELSASIPEEVRPDATQARIIASPTKTLRVTARAGSGKTRLLTALTYFLVNQCGYRPEEILLLAFNRDAADKLEEDLTRLLKISTFPGARTFHSLAYGIAQPDQAVLFNQGKVVATQQLTLLVQNILRGLLDPELLDEIYELFQRETAETRVTGAFLTGEAAYDFRRALRHYSLGGQAVRSRGEKFISDFLFEHGITYYYEDSFRWERGVYRPDFKIMTREKPFVIWEHWAVDPDAEHVSDSREWPEKKLRDYQKAARRKREFWKGKEIPLIESCADACTDREAFEREIADKLLPYFPDLDRLPKAQLMDKMKEVHLSRLAGWLGQAIQQAQKRGWDAAGLSRELIRHSANTDRETLFLALLEKVFAAYEPRLEAEGKTDFDRLFNRALELLRENPPYTLLANKQATIDLRSLRYCLVDEAQDLSPQFIDAVTCLRTLNPRIKLMFVGDDWQAINRFAGSDVELFTEKITTNFGTCARPNLSTNYRSVCKVVRAGNMLMEGQGDAAVAHKDSTGTIELSYLDKVWVEMRESAPGWVKDEPFRSCGTGLESFFKALYQLAIPDLVDGKTIGVLFRTNQSGGKELDELAKSFIRLIRRMGWPKDQVDVWQKEKAKGEEWITFSTAHRAKGKQWDTVFVVDPHAGNFPLLYADSIELFRFFGDSLEQAELDERRLFYVAITRAKERLVFLTETRRDEESPYLDTFRELIEEIQIPKPIVRPRQ